MRSSFTQDVVLKSHVLALVNPRSLFPWLSVLIKMPSGEIRYLNSRCRATSVKLATTSTKSRFSVRLVVTAGSVIVHVRGVQ